MVLTVRKYCTLLASGHVLHRQAAGASIAAVCMTDDDSQNFAKYGLRAK
jgi:hypothetical protein